MIQSKFNYEELDLNSSKFNCTSTRFVLTYPLCYLNADKYSKWIKKAIRGVTYLDVVPTLNEVKVSNLEDAISDEAILDKIKKGLSPEEESVNVMTTYVCIERSMKTKLNNNIFDYQLSAKDVPDEEKDEDEEIDWAEIEVKDEEEDDEEYETVTPVWWVFRSAKEFFKAKEFLTSLNGGEIEKPPTLRERVAECKTLAEALDKFAVEPSDVSGIKLMYELTRSNNLLERFTYEPNLPWQVDFLEHHDLEKGKLPDYRSITWYYDPVGNKGKTQLCKWLSKHRPNQWLNVKDLGTAYHASTLIVQEVRNGWLRHGVTINLSRGTENHDRMYTYLEDLKDGLITSQKYVGSTLVMDCPWVVVFSNFLPHLSQQSLDRWDIRKIEEDGNVRRLSLGEVVRIQKNEIMEKQSHMQGYGCQDEQFGAINYTESIVNALTKVKKDKVEPDMKSPGRIVKSKPTGTIPTTLM
jgi:hypothetical protein